MDICDVLLGRGGTVNTEGDVIFAPNSTGGLFLVSENGGTPREIIKSDSANSRREPALPVFSARWNSFSVYNTGEILRRFFNGPNYGRIIKI